MLELIPRLFSVARIARSVLQLTWPGFTRPLWLRLAALVLLLDLELLGAVLSRKVGLQLCQEKAS